MQGEVDIMIYITRRMTVTVNKVFVGSSYVGKRMISRWRFHENVVNVFAMPHGGLRIVKEKVQR